MKHFYRILFVFLASILLNCLMNDASLKAQNSLTFTINMAGQFVNPAGIHVAGNFNSNGMLLPDWDPSAVGSQLTLIQDQVYSITLENISFNAGSNLQFKFYNGIEIGNAESYIPIECGVDNGSGGVNRLIPLNEGNWCYSTVFSSSVCGTYQAVAELPNERCTSAIPIACGDVVSGTTTGASYAGVWYKFVGDGTPVTASTCSNADFSTYISVYYGSCESLSLIGTNLPGANTDVCATGSSSSFCSLEGETYYIFVFSYLGETGNFELSMNCSQPAIAEPYLSIGYQSGSIEICSGGSIELERSYSQNYPGTSLQWQSSSVSGGPYSDIPNANESHLTTPPESENTFYVAKLLCSGLETNSISNELGVYMASSVQGIIFATWDNSNGSTTTTDQPITACLGSTFHLNLYNQNAGSIIQWQKSNVSGGPYTDIEGANGNSFITLPLDGETYYVAHITCNGFSVTTNEIAIIPGISGGYINEGDFIFESILCLGQTTTLNYNAQVGVGENIQWKQSSSIDGPFTDISGENSFSFNTPPATDPVFYIVTTSCGDYSFNSTPYSVTIGANAGTINNVNYYSDVCPGTEISLSHYYNNPLVTFQWQQSTVSGGPYTDLPNGINPNSYSGTLNETSFYVVKGTCGELEGYSNEIQINALQSLNAGYLSSYSNSPLVCENQSANFSFYASYNSNNSVSYHLQESSTSGGDYTDVPYQSWQGGYDFPHYFSSQPITSNSYFVVKATCGTLTSYSNETEISLGVNPLTIYSGNPSVCAGGSSTLYSYGDSNGDVFQWQKSTVSGGPYEDIPGENGPTLSSPPINETTYFVLKTSCGDLSALSNEVQINLYDFAQAPYIYSNQYGNNICSGTSLDLLLGDTYQSGVSFQWQQSLVSGGPYTDIPGETNSELISAPIIENTYFVVKATCGEFTALSQETTYQLVTQTSDIFPYTINNYSLSNVCPDQPINLYGFLFYGTTLGASLQWQKSSLSGSNYVDIPNEVSSQLSNYSITENTYFNLKLSCGDLYVNSNEIGFTVGAQPVTISSSSSTICGQSSSTINAGYEYNAYAENQWQYSTVSGGPYIDLPGENSYSLTTPPISETSYFVLKTSCGGSDALSNELEIQVYNYASSVGIYGLTENTICSGISTNIQADLWGSQTGSTIQWQQSNVSGGPYTDVPNATYSYFTTPPITETTYYVLKSTCGEFNALSQEIVEHVVSQSSEITTGYIYNNGLSSVCPDQPVSLYHTASYYYNTITPGATLQWQSSPTPGSDYVDIPGATTFYLNSTLAENTYYTVKVSCGDIYANTNEIGIEIGAPQASIYPYNNNTVVCDQGRVQLYTNDYNAFSEMQWQYSTVSGGPYTDIPGENSTYLTTPLISETSYFVLKTSCGGNSSISNEIQVLVDLVPDFITDYNQYVCSGSLFSIGIYVNHGTSGVSYQWQKSAISGGPYEDIPDQTSNNLNNYSVFENTYFVLKSTCEGNSVLSNEVLVRVGDQIEEVNACSGSGYYISNYGYIYESGQYQSQISATNYCGYITITTNVTFHDPITTESYATINEGESYTLPDGYVVNYAGDFYSYSQGDYGCYNTHITHVQVIVPCFATAVVDFIPGLQNNGSSVSAARLHSEKSLGAPEPVITNDINFVSLGFGGQLTLDFGGPIANGDGADVHVYEATWNNKSCTNYPEMAEVFASQNGCDWIYVGTVCTNGGDVDFGNAISWARFIRIKDVSNKASFSDSNTDGYDVNAVACLHGSGAMADDGLIAGSIQDIVSYSPGNRKNGTAVPAPRNNANNAKGPASGSGITFVSLGFGGELIGRFDYVVFNHLSGAELQVIETSYGNPACSSYPERARFYVSKLGTDWVDLGVLCQDGNLEFGSLDWAQYIKIVDESPLSSGHFNGTSDAYDVDAVVTLGGCNQTARLTNTQMDVIDIPEEEFSVNLYPNPAYDFFQIEANGLIENEPATLSIFDATGRLVFSESQVLSQGLWTKRINCVDYAPGIYMVQLKTTSGQWTQKLIK